MRDSDARIDAILANMTDAPAAAAEPVPGTLHGLAGIKNPDMLWWVPTYADLQAMLEAEFPQTVMLAPAARADIFDPLRHHEKTLAAVQRFVLAGGRADFVAELARRLGRHRVWVVRWPQGIDGAADMLREQGEDALREAVALAEPYPLEGVYRPSAEAMIEYKNRPPIPTMTTGCAVVDAIVSLPTEGKLITVTGIPSHGKSTFMRHLMAHTALKHDRRWAVFSPEMGEWQDFNARVISWAANTNFRYLTDVGVAKWAEWTRPRFAYIAHDSEDKAPTLDWLIDTFRACVLRDGVTDCLLDPWNQVQHTRERALSESEYIDQALLRLSAFGRRHGCNVWIVAHPTKLRPPKPGDAWPVPNLYDVSGSAGWFNKTDLGLSIYRTGGFTQVHLLKAKFERWSTSGAGDAARQVFAETQYMAATGRFVAPDYTGEGAPPDAPPHHERER